jgi:23S rRNA (cytidine1920-2'-O)/16S rRNA (cytidine1409-2'-O)-methyltransferase
VKPQFEVGRAQASRGKGVVRDEGVRASAIDAAVDELRAAGFEPLAQADSVLTGPRGNREAFVHARRN